MRGRGFLLPGDGLTQKTSQYCDAMKEAIAATCVMIFRSSRLGQPEEKKFLSRDTRRASPLIPSASGLSHSGHTNLGYRVFSQAKVEEVRAFEPGEPWTDKSFLCSDYRLQDHSTLAFECRQARAEPFYFTRIARVRIPAIHRASILTPRADQPRATCAIWSTK